MNWLPIGKRSYHKTQELEQLQDTGTPPHCYPDEHNDERDINFIAEYHYHTTLEFAVTELYNTYLYSHEELEPPYHISIGNLNGVCGYHSCI